MSQAHRNSTAYRYDSGLFTDAIHICDDRRLSAYRSPHSECVLWWRPLAKEIKLRRKCALLRLEILPYSCAREAGAPRVRAVLRGGSRILQGRVSNSSWHRRSSAESADRVGLGKGLCPSPENLYISFTKMVSFYASRKYLLTL